MATIYGDEIDITPARHYRAKLSYSVTTDDDVVSVTYQAVAQMKSAYEYFMKVKATYTTKSGGSSSESSSGSATEAEYNKAGANKWFDAGATKIEWTVDYPRGTEDYYVECSVDVSCSSHGTSTAEDSIIIPAAEIEVECWDYYGDEEPVYYKSFYYDLGDIARGRDFGTTPQYSGYVYAGGTAITVSTSEYTVYRYFVLDIRTVYCDDTYAESGDLGTQSKEILPSQTFRGSDWGSSTDRDVYYSGYTYTGDDGVQSPTTSNRCKRFFKLSVYQVACHDWTNNGIDLGIYGEPKNYNYQATAYGRDWGSSTTTGEYHEGYIYSYDDNTEVTSDTTVNRYFTPAQYEVTCYDVVNNESGKVLGNSTIQLEYGLEVRGSEISSATYPGYNYIRDTSIIVRTSNNNVYRIFEPRTYYLQYELGPGHEDEPLPRSATYDEWFKIPDPVRLGYELAGWQMQGMSDDTHYHSPDSGVTRVEFFGPDADCVYGPYFMNLSSEAGTIYCNAIWKAKGLGRIYIPDDLQHPYHSALCFIYHTDETTGEGKYYQCIPYIYNNGTYRIGG